jgi:hypothetical protein
MDITAATIALETLLEREDTLSDDVLEIANEYLYSVYGIESSQIRLHIIQIAAINVGLLRVDGLD